MSEFNLTIGQAIDLMCEEKVIEDIGGNRYRLFDGEFRMIGNYSCLFNPTMKVSKYREYIEPKPVKIITWYRPKYIWDKNYVYPTINMNKRFFPTQEQASRSLSLNEKIINWENLEAPETWEQCE
jgi:hypothetical protein